MKEEDSPFKFGKIVHGERFSNRSKERNRLKTNFKSGLNTILISPRRWGKSSLIKEVASEYGPNSKTRFCFIDLMSIRTEEEFYTMFAKAVISATSSKMEEVMNKYGEDGWDVEFQLVEKRRLLFLWSREAAIITFSRTKN